MTTTTTTAAAAVDLSGLGVGAATSAPADPGGLVQPPSVLDAAGWVAQSNKFTERLSRLVNGFTATDEDIRRLVAEVKLASPHEHLGFKSWPAYLVHVMGEAGVKRAASCRRRRVAALLVGEGMSIRAASAVTGVARQTIAKDTRRVGDGPGRVVGLDGKSYSAAAALDVPAAASARVEPSSAPTASSGLVQPPSASSALVEPSGGVVELSSASGLADAKPEPWNDAGASLLESLSPLLALLALLALLVLLVVS